MGIEVDVKPLFCFGLYQIFLMKNKMKKKTENRKMEKRKKKRGKKKEEKTTRSSDPSSSPVSRQSSYNSTIYANLVFSPRIPIFFFIFILGIVTGIASRKALLFPSYKSSYFLSFGTDLLRDFYTFLLGSVVCPDVDPIRRCGFCDC